MTDQEWKPCTSLHIGDTLKWDEPLWAAPNKPRGKRDKIGEQQIVAELIGIDDLLELKVISVEKLSGETASSSILVNSLIKRKQSSLEMGNCFKLVTQ